MAIERTKRWTKRDKPQRFRRIKKLTSQFFDVGMVQVNNKKINVYVADTQMLRRVGLNHVAKPFGEDIGMLFLYDEPKMVSIDNYFIYVPVDIAFIDGRFMDIFHIETMTPEFVSGHKLYTTTRRALLSLAMNKGYFEENDIKKGNKLKIIDL